MRVKNKRRYVIGFWGAVLALLATACQADTTVTVAPEVVEAAAQPDPTAVPPPPTAAPVDPTPVPTAVPDAGAEPTAVPTAVPDDAGAEPTAVPTAVPDDDASAAPTATAVARVTPPTGTSEPSCSFARVDSFDDVQVFVEMIGEAGAETDFWITYDLQVDGVVFGDGSAQIAGVQPGEVIRVEDDSLENVPDDTPNPAEVIDCVVTDVRTTATEAIAGIEWTCSVLRVDTFDDIILDIGADIAEAFSASDPPQPVQYSVALRSADGVRFESISREIGGVGRDQRIRLEVDSFADAGANPADGMTCTVVASSLGFSDIEVPPSDAVCRLAGVDSFDDVQIEVTMTFPEGDSTVILWTALTDPDGVWVLNSSTFFDAEEYTPGQQNVLEADTFAELPPWADADTVGCQVVGIETF